MVIGSGFGGAVAAYQLVANTRLRVLLLERGMPYPPGSFARTPREMSQNFWDPGAGLHGLLEMWSFSRVRALVSSGLGGGSLIYANVMLPKPPETFAADPSNDCLPWPVSAAALAGEYADAATFLAPNTLPQEYADPPRERGGVTKTQQFLAAARASGLDAQLAPIAVTFRARDGEASATAPPVPGEPFGANNLHGRPRHTCTLVGECDLGCNEGAKNSLDYTYLSHFLREGRPGPRARSPGHGSSPAVRRRASSRRQDGGYRVSYVEHRAARAAVKRRRGLHDPGEPLLDPDTDETSDEWARTVTAGVVVVAGGTFGSTRLLLSSRPRLPRLSAQLGRRFSTNGDLLTVARECRAPDGSWRDLDPTYGPVITAYAEHTAEWATAVDAGCRRSRRIRVGLAGRRAPARPVGLPGAAARPAPRAARRTDQPADGPGAGVRRGVLGDAADADDGRGRQRRAHAAGGRRAGAGLGPARRLAVLLRRGGQPRRAARQAASGAVWVRRWPPAGPRG